MDCKWCGKEVDNLEKHKSQFHSAMEDYAVERTKGEIKRDIDKLTKFINIASMENPLNMGADIERLEALKNEYAQAGEAKFGDFDDDRISISYNGKSIKDIDDIKAEEDNPFSDPADFITGGDDVPAPNQASAVGEGLHEECPWCEGTGVLDVDECSHCYGVGRLPAGESCDLCHSKKHETGNHYDIYKFSDDYGSKEGAETTEPESLTAMDEQQWGGAEADNYPQKDHGTVDDWEKELADLKKEIGAEDYEHKYTPNFNPNEFTEDIFKRAKQDYERTKKDGDEADNYPQKDHGTQKEWEEELARLRKELGESWDFRNYSKKINAFESIGFTQGDAIKLSNLQWQELSTEVQSAIAEVEDAEKEEHRASTTDAFNDEGEQPDTTIPAGHEDEIDYDYNNIGESQTIRTKYNCEYCNSSFKSNESLSIHHNDIHAVVGETKIDGYEDFPQESEQDIAHYRMKTEKDILDNDQVYDETGLHPNTDYDQSGWEWQKGGESFKKKIGEVGWVECPECSFFSTKKEDAEKHKSETGHDAGTYGFSAVMPNNTANPAVGEAHIFEATEEVSTEEFNEEDHPRDDDGKFTSGGGGGESPIDLGSKSEKDLVKQIKGGSKNWKDWGRNEDNDALYAEIERRNREIPVPSGRYPKIFRDDPDAVPKMEQKIKVLEDIHNYWKQIIKFPARDWQNHSQLGDQKWFALSLASKNLNDARKKLQGIKDQQERGTKLVRKPTYQNGRKNFYYKEEPAGEGYFGDPSIKSHFEWVASMDQDDYVCKHCGKMMLHQGLPLHAHPDSVMDDVGRQHLKQHGITEAYAKEYMSHDDVLIEAVTQAHEQGFDPVSIAQDIASQLNQMYPEFEDHPSGKFTAQHVKNVYNAIKHTRLGESKASEFEIDIDDLKKSLGYYKIQVDKGYGWEDVPYHTTYIGINGALSDEKHVNASPTYKGYPTRVVQNENLATEEYDDRFWVVLGDEEYKWMGTDNLDEAIREARKEGGQVYDAETQKYLNDFRADEAVANVTKDVWDKAEFDIIMRLSMLEDAGFREDVRIGFYDGKETWNELPEHVRQQLSNTRVSYAPESFKNVWQEIDDVKESMADVYSQIGDTKCPDCDQEFETTTQVATHYRNAHESYATEMRKLNSQQKSLISDWVNQNKDRLSIFVSAEDLPYELYSQLEEINDFETLNQEIQRFASDVLNRG